MPTSFFSLNLVHIDRIQQTSSKRVTGSSASNKKERIYEDNSWNYSKYSSKILCKTITLGLKTSPAPKKGFTGFIKKTFFLNLQSRFIETAPRWRWKQIKSRCGKKSGEISRPGCCSEHSRSDRNSYDPGPPLNMSGPKTNGALHWHRNNVDRNLSGPERI